MSGPVDISNFLKSSPTPDVIQAVVQVAKPSGVAATDTANITAALDALDSKGGIVQFQRGAYFDTDQRTLGNYQILQGAGGISAGGNPGTVLAYTGTETSYISAQATTGVQIRDTMVFANNADFTGRVIDLSGAAALSRILGCTVAASDTTTAVDIYLDGSEDIVILGCNIIQALYGVQGCAVTGHVTDGISLIGNRFGSQGADGACVIGMSGGWALVGNIFELQKGQHAIAAGPSAFNGVTMSGNWFGDNPSTSGVDIELFGNGASIRGNYLGGNTDRTTIQFTGTSDGIEIAGNRFDTADTAIDKNSETVTNIVIGPNSYHTVTTKHNFTAAGSAYIEATS